MDDEEANDVAAAKEGVCILAQRLQALGIVPRQKALLLNYVADALQAATDLVTESDTEVQKLFLQVQRIQADVHERIQSVCNDPTADRWLVGCPELKNMWEPVFKEYMKNRA